MNDVASFNATLAAEQQATCNAIHALFDQRLGTGTSRLYHGSPVWFVDDNPLVGYSVKKAGVAILFWSGQSFQEPGLSPVGKHRAAEIIIPNDGALPREKLERWLTECQTTIWDYKNIAKKKGALELLTPTRPKVVLCLWYNGDAEQAARFYAATFPDSAVERVDRAPGDFPDGKQGDVLTVHFTVLGVPCMGLNGGPAFPHSEAFSFQVSTEDQAETDRYWNALVGNGGQESACGWCKDRWGLSWQITPRALAEAIGDPDPAAAKRAFDAMMTMTKIDIAAIEKARRGGRN